MKGFAIRSGGLHRQIGPAKPAFIVAEMSANHHHKYEKALEIIDAAAEAGADAVKLQTYTPDTITLDCGSGFFQVKGSKAWKGETLHSLYEKAFTPWEWQPELKRYAESKGLFLFSTPFDLTAVDFLEKMDVPLYKVSSFEIGHIPLLKRVGKTKKPVILSSGLATVEEISLAIETLKKAGCQSIAVLHCVVSYPAKPEEMNLSTISDMQKRFALLSGLSDHSLSTDAAVVSVSLGARVIEKHLIISRGKKGSDSHFSVEPPEFKKMVERIRQHESMPEKPLFGLSQKQVEAMLGKPFYGPSKSEAKNIVFRPSIWVAKDIGKGEIFTEENVLIRRPCYGMEPKHFEAVLGKRAAKQLKKCTPLGWGCVEKWP